MKVVRKYLFLIGMLFCTGLLALGWTADASKPSIGERFGTFESEKKVSRAEQTGVYDLDKAHSSIGFRIRHMGLVDVPGYFRSFEGAVDFDPSAIKNSSVEFKAEVKSIDTGVNARDNHLRSKDFFEVMTYPEMSFKSTRIRKKGKRYMVKGDLTIKDVTKEIEFPVRIYGPIKDDRGTIRMGVVGST
ncbi:MAG: YceI family protein, partial [Acidobacteriota bacterium]|nr:YceI family protein [Acidobacteriota bacterium]